MTQDFDEEVSEEEMPPEVAETFESMGAQIERLLKIMDQNDFLEILIQLRDHYQLTILKVNGSSKVIN